MLSGCGLDLSTFFKMHTYTNRQVGIIGIGVMGLPIALHLRGTGFAVTVRDIRQDAMAAAAAEGLPTAVSPAHLAAVVDVLIVIVVDAMQIEAVLFGADGVIHHAPRSSYAPLTVPLCSTIAPDDVARFAQRLTEYKIEAIDAQLGLNTQTLFDVINQSSGASWVFTDRMTRALQNDFAPRAALTLLTKDLTLACKMAQSVAQPTPVADAALAMFNQAVANELGALDDAAVIKVYP